MMAIKGRYAWKSYESTARETHAWSFLDKLILLLVGAACAFLILAVTQCGGERTQIYQETLPSFVGMNEDEAISYLTKKGWPFEVTYQAGDPEQKSKVISQDPEAGFFIDGSTTIFLKICKLKEWGMPQLTGMNREQALALLSQLGLEAQIGEVETQKKEENGVVLAQQPPPGTKVEEGERITITLGKYVQSKVIEETYVTCPACGGSGKINAQIHMARMVPCPQCGGKGYVELPYEGFITCPSCNGARIYTVFDAIDNWITCKKCGGSGRVRR